MADAITTNTDTSVNTSTPATNGVNLSLGSVPATSSNLPISTIPLGASSTTTAPITTIPVTTTPSASDITNSSPLIVPPTSSPATNTSQTSLSATSDSYMTPPAGTTTDSSGNAIPNPDASSSSRDAALQQILSDTNTAATEGQVQTSLNAQFGVDAKQQAAIDAYNQYQSKSVAYQQQEADIYNQPGITREQADAQVAEVSRVNNADLANLAIINQAAQNNYSGAMDIVQRKLDAEFQPIQQQITNLQSFLTANQNDLTTSQQDKIQGQIDMQKQNADELYQTKLAAHEAAVQNQAPASVLSAIDNATDVGSTLSALGQYGQVNDFQLTTDPTTGSPILFNAKTGQIQSVTGTNSSSQIGPADSTYTPSNPASVVNGYDLSSYAPNDPTYGTKVQNATSTLLSATGGTISTPTAAQSAISSVAPNSPITGNILMTAASQNNIDPVVLAGVMSVESNMGTTGAAVANNNPGNVKFVGQAGATRGSKAQDGGYFAKFATVQDGVNSAAATLANKQVNPQSSSPQATGAQSGAQNIQQLKTSAPAVISGAINVMPSTGDGYIDMSKVGDNFQVLAQNYAKTNGLATLNSDQVKSVQAIDTAISNVQQVSQQFQQIAPSNFGGKLLGSIANPLNEFFSTQKGESIGTYNSSIIPAALNSLSDITGTSGRFLSGISASSFPKIGGTSEVFTGDTQTSGQQKINNVLGYLNNALRSIIPTAQGVPVAIPKGTDGSSYGFPGYISDGSQWVAQTNA